MYQNKNRNKMERSLNEKHKKDHMEIKLKYFDTLGGLSQLEEILYMNTQ